MATVRTLKWDGYGDSLIANALGVKGFYRISGKPNAWTLTSPNETSFQGTPGFETQHAAMRAAQVDFNNRIESELV